VTSPTFTRAAPPPTPGRVRIANLCGPSGHVHGRPTARQIEVLGNCGEDIGPALNAAKASALLDILRVRQWRPRTALLLTKDWHTLPIPGGYVVAYDDPDAGRVILSRRFPTETAARLFIGRCVEEPEEPGLSSWPLPVPGRHPDDRAVR
jgi:hypothetical protein